MALFNECTQSSAHIVLDTADIVRDGDFSPLSRKGPASTSTAFPHVAKIRETKGFGPPLDGQE
jgi:hypothetical protein